MHAQLLRADVLRPAGQHKELRKKETCKEVRHVWVQVLHNIDSGIQEKHGVIVSVEQPLEAVPKLPAKSTRPPELLCR
jgi:hypothetical protein